MRTLQDRLLHLLGSSVERRDSLVARTLERTPYEVTTYWLQLVVSIGIATLGLVVGSVAVIIGAMLVAPLMGPILALAMGLATGSPFLVLRSAARILLSVVVAIGGAALISVLLPFHQLNAEIAARTSPTVLDLLTAGFCALAGVYASLRPGSDTASTAAGTSIGISLVPPLCASGYGVGTAMWTVAGGAALLFLTNLVAIIFVGTISFVAAGFNRVDAARLERDALGKNQTARLTAAIAHRLAGLFESNTGPALRFLMPIVLLAVVFVPLRRALDEVSWQVRARAAVEESLKREPHKLVQSRVRVERHEVDVHVVLLGTSADADTSRARLDARIRESCGVAPRIEVVAIPDAIAFAGVESALRTSRDPLPLPAPPPPPTPAEQLESAGALIRSTVARLWPAAAVGEPLVIEVGTGESVPLGVRVAHLGPALGVDGLESLNRGLGAALGREVQIVDVALPVEELTRSLGDLAFVARVSNGVRASTAISAINVCVERPRPPRNQRRGTAQDREIANVLRDVLSLHPRVSTQMGDDWSVRFVRGPCSVPAAADTGARQEVVPR